MPAPARAVPGGGHRGAPEARQDLRRRRFPRLAAALHETLGPQGAVLAREVQVSHALALHAADPRPLPRQIGSIAQRVKGCEGQWERASAMPNLAAATPGNTRSRPLARRDACYAAEPAPRPAPCRPPVKSVRIPARPACARDVSLVS